MNLSTYIIYVILNIIMNLIMIYCIKRIIELKGNNILLLSLTTIIISCINVINNLYSPLFLKLCIAFFLANIINYVAFKNRIKEIIIYTSIYLIITYLLELTLSIMLLMFKIQTLDFVNNLIILKCILSLGMGFFAILIFKNNNIIKFIKKLNKVINNNLNAFIFGTIFVLNLVTIYRYTEFTRANIISFLITFILYITITLKVFINDKYNIEILKEKNKSLKDSYKAYSNTIEECRELKHNLKNDLYNIKSLLPKDEQIKINNLITKYNKNYEWINKIEEIPEGLQGLIFLKQNEALQQKIKVFLNTSKKIETKTEDYNNIYEIVGILIDNAIDATLKTDKKIIVININETTDNLSIEIINKYTNNIDLNKISNKNYSTKEFKSGLGLHYIKKLKNNNIKVNFKIVNDLFISQINYSKK